MFCFFMSGSFKSRFGFRIFGVAGEGGSGRLTACVVFISPRVLVFWVAVFVGAGCSGVAGAIPGTECLVSNFLSLCCVAKSLASERDG